MTTWALSASPRQTSGCLCISCDTQATFCQTGLVLVSRTSSIKTALYPGCCIEPATITIHFLCNFITLISHRISCVTTSPTCSDIQAVALCSSDSSCFCFVVLCLSPPVGFGKRDLWRCRASKAAACRADRKAICRPLYRLWHRHSDSELWNKKQFIPILFALLYLLQLGCRNKSPVFILDE